MKKTIIKHGSDRKIQVIINNLPEGKTMKDVDFNVTFSAGGSSVSFAKSALKNPEGDIYIAPLSTKKLERGDLWMNVEVLIPDFDFEDNIRHEYHDVSLNAVIV